MTVVKKKNLKKSKFDRESHSTEKRKTAFMNFLLIQVAVMYICPQSQGPTAS